MSREQMLDLHDSLHEGKVVKSAKPAPFGIGSVLPDGSVVVSIGPSAYGVPTMEAVPMLGVSDRIKFRRSLLQAARQARDSGEITSLEYFLISASSRSPRVIEQLQAAVHEAAIEEGMASVDAVDWDALIAFIEKLIPIILKLLPLFV
jgi:hypothetical protein